MILPKGGDWGDYLGPPSYTLHLARRIQSANKFRYSKWFVAKKDKDDWFKELMWNIHTEAKPMECDSFCYVQITSRRNRILDHDNIVGGAKHLVDGLTRRGWIMDDTPHLVDVNYNQIKVPRKEEETIVQIWRTQRTDQGWELPSANADARLRPVTGED